MSGLFFDRKVSITVGLRGKPGTLLTGLRFVFKIEKTLEKTPNHTTIDIYNLSDETRAIFEQKGSAIRVTAGYSGSAQDIFIGDIATAVTKKSKADTITSIEAVDGLLAYQTKEADLSFAPGAKVGTILDTLISSFGFSSGEIQGVNRNDEYLNGLTVSGPLRTSMDILLQKQPNLEWSIQDNQFQILPKTKGSTKPAVLLTPDTGLVDSPFKRIVVNQDIAKKVEGKEAENGVNLKSLLNGDLVPGRLISLKAEFVSGTFKCEKVTHQGDTHANAYYSDIEAVSV